MLSDVFKLTFMNDRDILGQIPQCLLIFAICLYNFSISQWIDFTLEHNNASGYAFKLTRQILTFIQK